jgi:hypothetical protein
MSSILTGWIEIGMSNPNVFSSQCNNDLLIRTFDNSNINKIIVGNTSSNNTPYAVGAMYILSNNIGLKKVPRSNVDLDVNGLINSSFQTIGTTSSPGYMTLTGDLTVCNSNTSNMLLTNTSNTFKMIYGNVERLRLTNGQGAFLYDNVYVTNDVYANSYHMTSDCNLKQNIIPSNGSKDIEKLMQLQVCDYTLKKTGKKSKGFIAQNVETLMPDAVQEIDGIIPCFTTFVEIHGNKSNPYFQIDSSIDALTVGDKLVIGREQHQQHHIVEVINIKGDMVFIEGDVSSYHNGIFIHGKMGKIKNIDPQHILALCVSSLQEVIKLLV